MTCLWVGGGGSCGHDGLDDAQGGVFSLFDWRIFHTIGFELVGEAPAKDGVSLGLRGVSGVGEAIQEVGRCNSPPCLRNQLFPKSTHSALGVLGISEPVLIELEKFYARGGWILDINIYQQGGTEFHPV